MTQQPEQQSGVIADDLTGAFDAGIEFVRAGFSARLLIGSDMTADVDVVVRSTESRMGSEAQARQASGEAALQLAQRRIFKKIDSTMRGHVGAEVECILAATGQAHAVVCPAAIEAGRTLEGGHILVGGEPLHHTAFARDPHWPAATSAIGALIGVASRHIGGDIVAQGAGAVAAAITAASTPVVSVDARSLADLDVVGRACLATGSLPCGALGLARAWARALGGRATPLPGLPATGGPALVVFASQHPRSLAQARVLAERGLVAVETLGPHRLADIDQIAGRLVAHLSTGRSVLLQIGPGRIVQSEQLQIVMATLAGLVQRACTRATPGMLVLAGGETAWLVARALGMQAADLIGEVEVGVPWSRARGGVADGVVRVTKAGGFGDDQLLLRALRLS